MNSRRVPTPTTLAAHHASAGIANCCGVLWKPRVSAYSISNGGTSITATGAVIQCSISDSKNFSVCTLQQLRVPRVRRVELLLKTFDAPDHRKRARGFSARFGAL